MKHRLIGLSLFALILVVGTASSAQQPTASAPVTVSSVIKMVKAGVADDAVITMLRKSGKPLDLTPDDLISLKTSGVSDAVIAAMMNPSRNTAQPTRPPAESSPAPSQTAAAGGGDPLAEEAQAELQKVMKSFLFRCGERHYESLIGFGYNQVGQLRVAAKHRLYPARLTATDRRNGVEWYGRAAIMSAEVRFGAPDNAGHLSWESWRAGKTETVPGLGFVENALAIFTLEKRHGVWKVSYGQTLGSPFDTDFVAVMKPACREINPGPFGDHQTVAWTDRETGLTWARLVPRHEIPFSSGGSLWGIKEPPRPALAGPKMSTESLALERCKNLTVGSLTDWRVPSKEEIDVASQHVPDGSMRASCVRKASPAASPVDAPDTEDESPTEPPPAAATANPTASAAAYRTIDPGSVEATYGSAQAVVLDLALFRWKPSLLEDVRARNYFIRLNNCGDDQINRRLSNEFDYPQIAAFYKANAIRILTALPPATLTFRVSASLGQYDPTRKAFPFPEVRLDHFDVGDRKLSGCPTAAPDGVPASYQLTFPEVSLTELPMDEAAAKKYVAALTTRGRAIEIRFDVDIAQEAPKVLANGRVTVVGQIKSVTAVQPGPLPVTLGVLK